MHKTALLLMVLGAASSVAASLEADAQRGSEFFKTQRCVTCHSFEGVSKGKASDLGQRYDRNYTPAGITAEMWNHAPMMWAAMLEQNMPLPAVSAQQAADLFAFFYSVRYFEKPGEAERGKHVFQAKHCSECHAVSGSPGGPGIPVKDWVSLRDPVILVENMWDHADRMKAEMASRKLEWPRLASQDLADLLVYLQNLPETRNAPHEFTLPPVETGAELFENKRCTSCHKGGLALENRLGDSTLTDVIAGFWNESPKMQQPHVQLTLTETRQILAYVWAKQFFGASGDADRGRKTFESKKCAACHANGSSGAPRLTKQAEPYSSIGMVEVLWKHGPSMQRKMKERHFDWPQLSQSEMANLIAYLNSR